MAFDDALLAAYHATCYRVQAPGTELRLHIGRHEPLLAKLLREAWVEHAALLTAWNPGSQPQEPSTNEASHQALLRELQAAGYPCLHGRNEPADGSANGDSWIEPSVLALDVTFEAARAIAARYGQLAFLWIDRQATPRLVITAAGTQQP
jgi:hypothetical protein